MRMNQPKLRILLAGLTAFCAIFLLTYYAYGQRNEFDARAPYGDALEQPPAPAEMALAEAAPAPVSCRYGVAYLPGFQQSLQWVPTLGAGWYINFGIAGAPVNSAEFAPVVRLRQNWAVDAQGNRLYRLPTYTFNPPLVYQYLDQNNRLQNGLGAYIANSPGQLWIIGNEPDVNNDVQDNIFPQVYARAYHDAYQFIKRMDPTARVAVAGLSMMTPGRLQYLTLVWDTYRQTYGTDMPVDVWNMHLYILEERNPLNTLEYGDGKIALGTDPAIAKLSSNNTASFCPNPYASDTPSNDPRPDVYCISEHDSARIFSEQVIAMRQWMKARGQQNKPLIISEFGLLFPYVLDPGGTYNRTDEFVRPFDPGRVTTYMNRTMDYMENTKDPNLGYPADENRLIQQWLWYSIVTDLEWSGGSSNLIINDYAQYPIGSSQALTPMGYNYLNRATTAAMASTSNLAGGEAANVIGSVSATSNKVNVTLTASFRNSGTLSIVDPVTVTFYAGSPGNTANPIGSAVYNPASSGAIAGCTWGDRNSERVSIRWNDLPVGNHTYWARIDSTNVIAETNEGDNNTTMGRVTIYPYSQSIPVINR